MRHLILALATLAIPFPAAAQALRGVWKPVEVTVMSGGNAETRSDTTGLVIITDHHYSVTLAATASAGTYDVTDVAVILMPSVMVDSTGPVSTQALPLRLVADSMWLTTKQWYGAGVEARLKLVRVSGAPVTAARGGNAGRGDRQMRSTPAADDASLLIGAWRLNPDKSEFNPGPAPQSMQVTYERTDTGIRFTSTTVDASGNTVQEEWVGIEDGRDYPYKGNRDFDTQSVRITGRQRAEIITKRGGRIAMGGDRVISSNGKVLTVTLNGTNANGQVVRQEMVFERQ